MKRVSKLGVVLLLIVSALTLAGCSLFQGSPVPEVEGTELEVPGFD